MAQFEERGCQLGQRDVPAPPGRSCFAAGFLQEQLGMMDRDAREKQQQISSSREGRAALSQPEFWPLDEDRGLTRRLLLRELLSERSSDLLPLGLLLGRHQRVSPCNRASS
jgi:hypothetical protein